MVAIQVHTLEQISTVDKSVKIKYVIINKTSFTLKLYCGAVLTVIFNSVQFLHVSVHHIFTKDSITLP